MSTMEAPKILETSRELLKREARERQARERERLRLSPAPRRPLTLIGAAEDLASTAQPGSEEQRRSNTTFEQQSGYSWSRPEGKQALFVSTNSPSLSSLAEVARAENGGNLEHVCLSMS